MNKIFIAVMFLALIPAISHADIYKYQDPDGRIYYSPVKTSNSYTRIIKTDKTQNTSHKKIGNKKTAKTQTTKAAVSTETTVITKPNLIISNEPFMQNGTVKTSDYKTEKGVFSGVHYHFYYLDGSGTFSGTSGNVLNIMERGNWNVGCKKDAITDKKMCKMNMKNLWIYVYENGGTIVSIGDEHFPGSSVTIRIDGGSRITDPSETNGDFPVNTSEKIIEQLEHSKTLTTRYMKWPYKSWIDESWEIYGFNETYKYINWAVRHIK